jgi:branched-chain amino acid transport system substrate-binding protein
VQKYKDRYSATPDALAALAYDAARVLADAMKRAGKLDGPSIRDAIAATQGFGGVTGTINLGADRNPQGKKLVIVEVRNGQLALKASVDPTGATTTPTTDTSATGATTNTGAGTQTTGNVPSTATTTAQ